MKNMTFFLQMVTQKLKQKTKTTKRERRRRRKRNTIELVPKMFEKQKKEEEDKYR